jgi:hypothetical protein
MGGYARAVSGQRVGKLVPAATNTHAPEERDVLSKGQGFFFGWGGT